MSIFMAALMLQYVVSVKAGLVNHVQGTTNVATMETVGAGHSIKTGPDGFVEILLRPGSFLRLGENSEASLDDNELASVRVTILNGPALIEASEINKDHPITVTTGNLTTKIVENGIYRFEDGIATVLQGKLQTGSAKLTYEKGWAIFFKDNYRARKMTTVQETNLDVYSQARSEVIANANFSMASTLMLAPSYSPFDFWLYSPNLRLYTFIPSSDSRSPYGYRYYGIGHAVRRDLVSGTPSQANGNSGNSNNTQPDNSNNSSSSASAAPAPTASTPSGERSTPAVYVDSKNSAVGATVR